MAPRITALDWDSYKNRESIDPTQSRKPDGKALETEEDRLQASFDINRGARDAEEYVGNEPRGAMPEKMSIVALVKSNPLTVPHISGAMDNATAARSAQQYYAGILQEGGPRALKLIRDAASEGNKAVQKAREIGNGDDFTVVASHQGAAQVTAALVHTALELYPASREDALKRGQQFNPHHEEDVRKTLARARKENLGSRDGIQKLPTDASKVDFKAIDATFNARVRPHSTERLHPTAVAKVLDPSHLVRQTDEKSDDYGRVVDLRDSLKSRVREGYHEAIIDHANSPARAGSMAIPPSAILSTKEPVDREGKSTGVALSDEGVKRSRVIFADAAGLERAKAAIAAAGADEEIIVGSMANDLNAVKTSARKSVVHNAKSSTYVLEQHGYSGQAARYLENGKQMINHATHAEFYLGDEPNSLNAFLVGHAAARGNIATVYQGDRQLSLPQSQALGATQYMTAAQMVRRGLASGLEAEGHEPAAAVGLSLLRSPDGRMSNADILAVQASGLSLREAMDAAQDPNKARELITEHRVSMQGARILKTGDAAHAGSNLPLVLNEVQGKGLALVGPEDFPAALRNSNDPNAPVYAVISGDVDAFRNAKSLVGIIGDRLRSDNPNDAKVAASVAPHMAALEATKQPRVWVDGQTPFPMEPRKGDVIIVPGGLGVFNNEGEKAAQDARDLAGAITVSFDKVPSTRVFVAGKGRSKGKEENIENTPNESMAPTAARHMAMMAERLVITNGRSDAYSATKEAAAAHLRTGKRVLVIEAPAGVKNSLTTALARGEGQKALLDAGLGRATVEDQALQAVKGGPVAIRLNPRNPEGAAKAVVDLVKGKPQATDAHKPATKTQEDVR